MLKGIEYGLLADGQAYGVARILQENGYLLVEHALLGTAPQPPFFDDYAAFLVDFFGLKADLVRPVLQNLEGRFHHFGAVGGHG